MDSIQTSQALKKARALVTALESYDGTVEQHRALLRSTDGVRATMEGANQKMYRWLQGMSCAAAMNLLVRIGALEKIPTDGSLTASELAASCRVDTSIITRAMRLLVVEGVFHETSTANEYTHNQASRAFCLHDNLKYYVSLCVDMVHALIVMPEYCATHEPADLHDLKKSPMAFKAGMEGKTFWELIDVDPKQREIADLGLQCSTDIFPILGMFPFRDLIKERDDSAAQASQERPYIVNIGGGKGQDLLAIQKDCQGQLAGRLVLQDAPTVINSLKSEDIPGIKPMVYDIFTRQPIKDAHVYLKRRLLHDFPDAEAIEILRNTASAMAPDSRLVICEILIPDRVEVGGPMTMYWLDFILATICGKERSRVEFESLCSQAGLEIVRIYPSRDDGCTVMIETRLLHDGVEKANGGD